MATLVSDVNTRVRSLVGDSGTDWTTSAILLPYINAAYAEVATQLRARGATLLRKTSNVITGPTSPIPRGTYPTDLIRPIEIVERQSGVGTFVRMTQSTGFLNDRAATLLYGQWDWKNDSIYLPGTTGTVDIKIEYDAALTVLTADGDTLVIPDCLNAVAFLAAAYAVRGRGQPALYKDLLEKGQAAVDQLTASDLDMKGAMSGRWGPADQTTTVTNTVQAALRLASSLINDNQAPKLNDSQIFGHIRSAYRDIVRRLRAEGVKLFRRTSSAITVPSGTKALLRSSGTTYPSDLMRPLELMEKVTGGGGTYRRMSQNVGLFDDRAATALLQNWEWKDDGIRFGAGASGDVDVVIEYEATVSELVDSRDTFAVPDCIDAVAYLAASYAMAARAGQDPAVAARVDARAQASVAALVSSELGVQRALEGRWGLQDQTTPTVGRVTAQYVIHMASPFIARALEGPPMSDAEILGFMRMAYQDVVKALRAAEVNVFLRQTTLVITAGTTAITRTSTPPLPSDLVRPYRIATLADNDPANRTAIVRTTANALQAVSDNTMGLWAWRDDGIQLSPSVFNYGVTIQYEAMLPDITSPQDEIKIPDGATAVAMMTAAYAVIMDKPEAAKGLKDRALEIVADIARSEKMAAAANTGNDFFDNG